MNTKEISSMDPRLGATQLHIDELDREIETIRMERLLSAATPPGPTRSARGRAAIGRGLVSLGVALIGDTRKQASPTAGTSSRG
jgi:hypothetical protein